PGHTFHHAGDEDWVQIRLGQLVVGSTLTIRTSDLTSRGVFQTNILLYLYRPGATASDRPQLFRFNNVCLSPNFAGQRGSCIEWTITADDAARYNGQTWPIRVRGFEAALAGADIGYTLSAYFVLPVPTATPTTTGTATTTA